MLEAGRQMNPVTTVDAGDTPSKTNQAHADTLIVETGIHLEHPDGGAPQTAVDGPTQFETEDRAHPSPVYSSQHPASRVIRQFGKSSGDGRVVSVRMLPRYDGHHGNETIANP
jgi:hypothetical protein